VFALAYPLLRAGGLAASIDGRVAVVSTQVLRVEGPPGVRNRVELPSRRCTLTTWGAKFLASCYLPEDGAHGLFVTDGERPFTELRRGTLDAGGFAAAKDGGVIAIDGACENVERERDEATPVCVYDGGTWHTRALPGRAVLLDASGDALLYRRMSMRFTDPHNSLGELRVLRNADNDADGRAIQLDTPGAVLVSASFASGGVLAGIAVRGNERFVAIGTPDRPLALRALPSSAERVAFADPTRGIASGRDLSHVWVTTDGARTWSRLSPPIDGDASGVALALEEPRDVPGARSSVECDPTTCVVGERLVWSAPVAGFVPPPNPLRIQGAATAPTDSARDPVAVPAPDNSAAGLWQCEPRIPARPTVRPSSPNTRPLGGEGWIEPHITAAHDALAGRYAFVWGGFDDRGRFRTSARPTELPAVAFATTTPDDFHIMPRLVTRSLAIVERCAQVSYATQCELLAVPRGGAPRILGTERALLEADPPHVSLRSVLPLPDGGALVQIAPTADDDFGLTRVDLVLRLSPRGEIVARRSFAWGRAPAARLLARTHDAVGLAVATLPDTRSLTFYTLDPADDGRPLGTIREGQLTPCATPDASANATVVLGTGRFAPTVFFGETFLSPASNEIQSLLEIDAQGGVCMRGAVFFSNPTNLAREHDLITYLGGVPRLRVAAGALAGRAIDSDFETDVTCVLHR
jgi:hypothetical protein